VLQLILKFLNKGEEDIIDERILEKDPKSKEES
jgi:hypothetical protein